MISMVGLPYCLYIYLGAHRPEIVKVTEETVGRVMPIPLGIIVLSVLSLALGRSLVGPLEGRWRGWSLAMILISLLMVLLLFTESPY